MLVTPDSNKGINTCADRPVRVAFATLGCKVNQAETETLTREFKAAGFLPVPLTDEADLFIINTCTVTHVADRKSRQMIRQIHRSKPAAKIVVTGCYAQLEAEAIREIEGVDLIVGTGEKSRLLNLVKEMVSFQPGRATDAVSVERPEQGRTRGLVKIQDGCNNFCSYCIVPHARGRSRSISADNIVQEISALVQAGHQEIVLTGVHAGAYGTDGSANADIRLTGLIQRILNETNLPRLRLSSVEPWDLEPALLELLSDPRLCRHLHLPLQSGSDTVLARMRRRYSAHDFAALVERVRARVEGIAITTDVIVGFPGESEKEFAESFHFCQKMGFARIHVFKYSVRRGTLAATMADQIDERVKNLRSDRLIGLSEELARSFHAGFLNSHAYVLWENCLPRETARGKGEHPIWTGLTDNYIKVYADSNLNLGNRILYTQLVDHFEDGLWGQIDPVD